MLQITNKTFKQITSNRIVISNCISFEKCKNKYIIYL